MNLTDAELQRRKLLAASVAGTGAIGLVATAIPFLSTLAPSERARAAGAAVEYDVSRLAEGALETVEWRGRPVWVLHRSPAMLASLAGHDADLADPQSQLPQQPDYAANPVRARRPPFLVVTALCTHLGCVPNFRPVPGDPDVGPGWPGGFYCPCHGSRFDLAGRVFRNVPAPRNLEVPPYTYTGPLTLLIGDDKPT
jgi:ubiquinol-cytochrome c reductase iron-sulfur subunit